MGTYAPLAVSGYRKVWGAAVVSNVGTFLQLTAGPWLMNELTGSPLMVSLVTAALSLPRLLLTIPAGALADALDRRNLMITGNLVGAVSTGAMAIMVTSGTITAEWLLAWTFLLGVGSAITLPAQQTLVPDLVPANMRAQAITLNSAAFNVARAVGPSIGGLLVSAGLTAASFGINAATFVLVVGVLLFLCRVATAVVELCAVLLLCCAAAAIVVLCCTGVVALALLLLCCASALLLRCTALCGRRCAAVAVLCGHGCY